MASVKDEEEESFDYDLFVIGGGSGGVTAANRAAKLGKRVALADFVAPSPRGTTWGVGGTCLNVGCIPKKLMHYAAQLGDLRADQTACGWPAGGDGAHSWEEMVQRVNDHVRSSNWKIKVGLNENNVKFFNAFARFEDAHTLLLRDKKGAETRVTARYVVVAVGGRPFYPATPGCRELCVTSDDLFWLQRSPGKTLVIGAGYVGMECGGFLRGLGCEVEVLHRGEVLAAFDRDMVERIREDMAARGVRFTRGTAEAFERADERVRVRIRPGGDDAAAERTEEYDTVLLALSRYADLHGLALDRAGVAVARGKITVDEQWRTSAPSVFAIGDATSHNKELTPVAIREGQYLVRGLFLAQWKRIDYEAVATTVFTPLEYSVCGLGEREALARFGAEGVDVYHNLFKPLEWNYLESRGGDAGYCKVIVRLEDRRVLGVHYLGPHAGEVMGGFAVAVRIGVSFEQLQDTIGIHPTSGEELLALELTKREAPSPSKADC